MWPGPLKQYFRYFAGVVLFYKAPHVPVPVNTLFYELPKQFMSATVDTNVVVPHQDHHTTI